VRRFRSRSRGRSGSRRKLTWGDSWWDNNGINISAGASGITANWVKIPAGLTESGAQDAFHEPEDQTLVRSYNRHGWSLYPTGSELSCLVGAGTIVWDDVDTAIDAVSIPLPISTLVPDSDWIWKEVFPVRIQNTGAGGFSFSQLQGGDVAYWSRAQRKLSAKSGILVITQCLNDNDADDVNFFSMTYNRLLFKEP